MGLQRLLKSRKYLLQIYFAITIAAVITVTIVIWAIFYAIKGTVVDIERKTSLEMLNQIKSNIGFIQTTSEQMCYSVFRNNDVQSLMYQRDASDEELMQYVNRIADSYLSTNPSIKSIYIYNAYQDQYYSTYNGVHNTDDNFLKLTKQSAFDVNLVPIMRFDGKDTIATFTLRENYGADTDGGSTIYLNMHSDWIFNYLESVNRITDVQSNSLYVFNADNNCINNDLIPQGQELSKELSQHMSNEETKEDVQLFDATLQGESYTVTVLKIHSYDWKLVRIYPYDKLFAGLSQVRLMLIIFNAVAVLSIMFLFAFLANKIYQPVSKLMKHVNINSDEGVGVNEFEILEKSYILSKDELMRLEHENATQNSDMREYALKRLLTQADIYSGESLGQLVAKHNFSINLEKKLSLFILSIADFSTLKKEYNKTTDKASVLFGICNVMHEIFSEIGFCEVFCVAEGQIAVICNHENSSHAELAMLRKAKAFIKQIFSLDICGAVQFNINAQALCPTYTTLQAALKDRFMLGEGCVITEEIMQRQTDKLFENYNFSEEIPFLESLQQLKLDICTKLLEKLILQIKRLDYEGACLATKHLTDSMQKAVFEVNKYRKEPIVTGEYQQFWRQVPYITLDQYHKSILSFIENLQSNYQHGSTKHQILAETIKDYIDKMYDNYDLGAATIADMLKVSSAHAGRVFNTYMNMSIPEYINDVRMNKAIEWMQNSDFSVQEIMSKVGYSNESYFYKIFKDRYNTTPRSYVKETRGKIN